MLPYQAKYIEIKNGIKMKKIKCCKKVKQLIKILEKMRGFREIVKIIGTKLKKVGFGCK